MKTDPEKPLFTRRDAMQQTLFACLGVTAAQAASADAASELPPSATADLPFVPENDYPFFGCELNSDR